VLEAMKILDNIFKERSDIKSHQILLKNLAVYSLDLKVMGLPVSEWVKMDEIS
jgi:hypothetical protein